MTTPWIQTYTGKAFHFLNPTPEAICIEDIAHALSQIPRFNGHAKCFYSVAQHSVFVSHICHPRDAMAGLLHDASEAYMGDVTRPLKMLLPEYKLMERKVSQVIASTFGIADPMPPSVKDADEIALTMEALQILPVVTWELTAKPLPQSLETPWTPEEAKQRFLERYQQLLWRNEG